MPGPLDFTLKFSCLRPARRGDTDDLLTHLESDRGRIIQSAAVRRLQQKTQVFPLERNAAVRSRLTHSLEVQQIGRFIVRTLYQRLGADAARHGLAGLERPLESLVEMACLMHDVGNPPFGHFGEYALNDWFGRHLDTLFDAAAPAGADPALAERMRADLKGFEGNAQAIRLVVRLLRLNLTYTQTAGLLKYVRPAYRPRPDRRAPGYYLNKKPGYYLSEEAFVDDLRATLRMAPGTRHPITYVMEAADDISYCLADIEDSVEKGILDVPRLARLLTQTYARHAGTRRYQPVPGSDHSFQAMVRGALKRWKDEPINKVGEFFIALRVSVIHPLVQHAAGQFIDNLEAVYHGTLDRALMEDHSLPHAIVQTFKDVALTHVFCHPEVETLELQGYRIIQGLLDFYAPLLRLDAAAMERLASGEGGAPHANLLARRLPTQQRKAYLEALKAHEGADAGLWEFYYRCRMLQDFVSGMTDQHAQDEYRTLSAL